MVLGDPPQAFQRPPPVPSMGSGCGFPPRACVCQVAWRECPGLCPCFVGREMSSRPGAESMGQIGRGQHLSAWTCRPLSSLPPFLATSSQAHPGLGKSCDVRSWPGCLLFLPALPPPPSSCLMSFAGSLWSQRLDTVQACSGTFGCWRREDRRQDSEAGRGLGTSVHPGRCMAGRISGLKGSAAEALPSGLLVGPKHGPCCLRSMGSLQAAVGTTVPAPEHVLLHTERGRQPEAPAPRALQPIGVQPEGACSAHCPGQGWPAGLQLSWVVGLPGWPVYLPVACTGPQQCLTGCVCMCVRLPAAVLILQ